MSTVLEQHLVELAQRIDVVDDERLVDDVLARLDSPVRRSPFESRRRSLAVVGLLTAAAVALVFVLPSPRRTVAHWFGIGSVRIEGPNVTLPPQTSAAAAATPPPPTSTPVTFPSTLDLGQPTSADDASSRTGLPTPLASTLGAPTGVYVATPPESGQIVVVYPPTSTLRASPVAGVGALLSTLPGEIDEGLFLKVQEPGTTVETFSMTTATGTTVDAIWLAGEPHDYLFVDRNNEPVFDTLRLATHTLLWTVGDVTYRLEADVSRDAAVAIARSVVPA